MLNLLKKLFSVKKQPELNLETFGHPLAFKTSWKPKAHGGSNFKTRSLKSVSNQKIEMQASGLSKFIFIFFLVGGIIGVSVGLGINFNGESQIAKESMIKVLLFLIPFGIGGIIGYFVFRPIVFDKKHGYFYKSYRDPSKMDTMPTKKSWIPLDSIVALQIISERVKTKNSSYISYELNFVFSDGERYNVLDHGNYEALREDSTSIATFIGVPLWNAISQEAYTPSTISSKGNFEEETDQPFDSTKPDNDTDAP